MNTRLLLGSLLSTAMLSAATLNFYTDQSAFLAATNVTQTIDFEGIAPAGGEVDYEAAGGLTVGGVTFTGPFTRSYRPNPFIFGSVPDPPVDRFFISVVDAGKDPAINDFGTGATLQALGSYDSVALYSVRGVFDVILPAGTNAVGLNLMTIGVAGPLIRPDAIRTLNISVNAGPVFSVDTLHRPNLAFAGFTSDDPITSLEISPSFSGFSNTYLIVADNVLVGSAVPEPASAMLVLAGVASAFALRRRRHQKN